MAALGLGGLAASRAEAAAGENLVLGEQNDAGSEPTLATADVAGPASAFEFTNTSGTGPAIRATSADVRGAGTTGPLGAVTGDSSGGYGVAGRAAPGEGGAGLVGFCEDGNGLEVYGRNEFSQAGVVTIPEGKRSRVVSNPLLQVSPTSLVIACVQGDPAGVHVASAKRVPGGKIRVYLTGNAKAGGVKVGYFVIN
jgi:hypothetical protein